jgi:hypothetical protein
VVIDINVGSDTGFCIHAKLRNKSGLSAIKLILNYKEIGTFEDEQVLGVFTHQIQRLINLETLKRNEVPQDTKEAFEYLDSEESGKYYLSLGECFDDFSIRAFRENKKVHILWELSDEPFFSYKDPYRGIQHETFDICDVEKVMKSLKVKLGSVKPT